MCLWIWALALELRFDWAKIHRDKLKYAEIPSSSAVGTLDYATSIWLWCLSQIDCNNGWYEK